MTITIDAGQALLIAAFVLLLASAVLLTAVAWTLHRQMARLVDEQPRWDEPLDADLGDEQTWRAVREALGESATDMERTPA